MVLKNVLMFSSRLEPTPPSRTNRDVPLSTLPPSAVTLVWSRPSSNMAALPLLPTNMATPPYTGLHTMDMTSASLHGPYLFSHTDLLLSSVPIEHLDMPHSDHGRNTALHLACLQGHEECAIAILEKCNDELIHVTNAVGKT